MTLDQEQYQYDCQLPNATCPDCGQDEDDCDCNSPFVSEDDE